MAFTRKAGQTPVVTFSGKIPEPPRVPGEMVRRFPELEQYDKDLQDWWSKFSDQLQRDRGQIESQFQSISTDLTQIKAKLP